MNDDRIFAAVIVSIIATVLCGSLGLGIGFLTLTFVKALGLSIICGLIGLIVTVLLFVFVGKDNL